MLGKEKVVSRKNECFADEVYRIFLFYVTVLPILLGLCDTESVKHINTLKEPVIRY
jgi:hypothetical protein